MGVWILDVVVGEDKWYNKGMDSEKFLLKSKGVVGSIIAIVGTIAQVATIVLGTDFSFVTPELQSALLNIVTGVGAFIALYGRITATTKLHF